jgi:hypothetical protein
LFDGPKEAFNLATPTWVAGPRKGEFHFEISSHLFQMLTGKI